MLGHLGLVNGTGVVIKTAGDRQVDREVFLGNAEVCKVLCDGLKLIKPLVEHLVHALVALKSAQDLLDAAGHGHEVHDIVGLVGEHMQLVHEYLAHLVGANLVELVDRAHYLAGLLLHARKPVKAVQNLAVIDLYPELFKTELCKGAVNYRRYLGFVYDI